MYYSGIANWDKAIELFKKAIELGNDIGDCRLIEECTYLLCSCLFFQGKIIGIYPSLPLPLFLFLFLSLSLSSVVFVFFNRSDI
jgi:hypothetical protein